MSSNHKVNFVPIFVVGLVFLFGQIIIFAMSFPTWTQIGYAALFVLAIFAGSRKNYYIFVIRVVTPVSIGCLAMLIYKYAYTFDFTYNFLEASVRVMSYIENFFSFVSVLYAITTAFLLWKGLSDHDQLKHALNDEASKVRGILYYTSYFNQNTKTNAKEVRIIKQHLHDYVQNIVDRDRAISNEHNDVVLSNVISIVSNIEVEDENDKIALGEIMKEIGDLSTIRTRRQNYLDSKISPYLLAALVTMSISIVYPFFTIPPQNGDPTPFTMIFILSTLLSFMYITMIDISSPFAGFWKVKTDSLTGIRLMLEAEFESDDDEAAMEATASA